jgi:hypothetical protein
MTRVPLSSLAARKNYLLGSNNSRGDALLYLKHAYL